MRDCIVRSQATPSVLEPRQGVGPDGELEREREDMQHVAEATGGASAAGEGEEEEELDPLTSPLTCGGDCGSSTS